MPAPLTPAQFTYYEHLCNKRVALIVVNGPSGTGKTFLASKAGNDHVSANAYKKLIITRPAVAAGEDHGYLPGTLGDKMKPWVKPMTDHLSKTREPEVIPLGYMRGLTFDDSWIIADEMQNSTKQQMKMILTRIGHNSKLIVAGDLSQCDAGHDGLVDLIHRVKNTPSDIIKYIQLGEDDVHRSKVVKEILRLYQ